MIPSQVDSCDQSVIASYFSSSSENLLKEQKEIELSRCPFEAFEKNWGMSTWNIQS